MCANGFHACTISQLPYWIGSELWEVDLAGDIVDAGVSLVASRARLVRLITGWDQAARIDFATDCAARAARFAGDSPAVVDFITRVAERGAVGEAAYWSAVLAGETVAGRRSGELYDGAFAAERAEQARKLSKILAQVS
ncbi:MAG: hypothetical protein ACP5P1_03445 [Acidimicrobiales bacterium]